MTEITINLNDLPTVVLLETQRSILLSALKKLGRPYPSDLQLCFCKMGIGHPLVKEHSPDCVQARHAIQIGEWERH